VQEKRELEARERKVRDERIMKNEMSHSNGWERERWMNSLRMGNALRAYNTRTRFMEGEEFEASDANVSMMSLVGWGRRASPASGAHALE
jgi:hypothetical protein